MSTYLKYHLGLAGQIVLASAVYGALIYALAYLAPADKWKNQPGEWASTLGLGSAAMAAGIGLLVLGFFVARDQIAERSNT